MVIRGEAPVVDDDAGDGDGSYTRWVSGTVKCEVWVRAYTAPALSMPIATIFLLLDIFRSQTMTVGMANTIRSVKTASPALPRKNGT